MSSSLLFFAFGIFYFSFHCAVATAGAFAIAIFALFIRSFTSATLQKFWLSRVVRLGTGKVNGPIAVVANRARRRATGPRDQLVALATHVTLATSPVVLVAALRFFGVVDNSR